MTQHTATSPRLILDVPTRQLLDAVEADPLAPMTVGVPAPGGHGKSTVLAELARVYRAADVRVVGLAEFAAEGAVPVALLVDDAHQLSGAQLGELTAMVGAGRQRVAVAFRPWPRLSRLAELAEVLGRTGPLLSLAPWGQDQVADYLADRLAVAPTAAALEFTHSQTGGIPRFVSHVGDALAGGAGWLAQPDPQLPRSVIDALRPDVDRLDQEVERYLLAVEAGVGRHVELLGALLGVDLDRLGEVMDAARATGLLGADGALLPIARRAVGTLVPAERRIGIRQRLAEIQHERGGPVLDLAKSLLGTGVGGSGVAAVFQAAAAEALPTRPALAAKLFGAAEAAGTPITGLAAGWARAAARSGDLDRALRLADQAIATPDAPHRAEAAEVAAAALAHRGQLGRSAELYRWAGPGFPTSFAAIGLIGTGQVADLERQSHPESRPTLAAGAERAAGGSPAATASGSSSAEGIVGGASPLSLGADRFGGALPAGPTAAGFSPGAEGIVRGGSALLPGADRFGGALPAELMAAGSSPGAAGIVGGASALLPGADRFGGAAPAEPTAAGSSPGAGRVGSAPALLSGAGRAVGGSFVQSSVESTAAGSSLGEAGGVGGPPTLLAGAATLMAQGVLESIVGSTTSALSKLVRASALLEPGGQSLLLPDSPAALAALVGLHGGELALAESVLDRATLANLGGALLAARHRLLLAWIAMARGRMTAAREHLVAATRAARVLEPRDWLFAVALEVGLARRSSDLATLRRTWSQACEAVMRHPVDLFTVLPLGEFAVAAARLREGARLRPHLDEAWTLLAALGNPPLWATPLHWHCLHAAIIAEQPAVAAEHARALAGSAGHCAYCAVLATAAESWLAVVAGHVDADAVESAARGLHEAGLCWDGARLAGQAAIRTSDRKAMVALLNCARVLQGRAAKPANPPRPATDPAPPAAPTSRNGGVESGGVLSDREREVAASVLAGLTYKQVGDRLFISAKTVEHHVARMRQKLGATSRAELFDQLRQQVGGTQS